MGGASAARSEEQKKCRCRDRRNVARHATPRTQGPTIVGRVNGACHLASGWSIDRTYEFVRIKGVCPPTRVGRSRRPTR